MVLSYKNLIEVSVPSQESDEGSCMYVLRVSVPSQESNEGSCMYVLEVMYLCVKGIDIASFYDFDIGLLNCPDSVFFFILSSKS